MPMLMWTRARTQIHTYMMLSVITKAYTHEAHENVDENDDEAMEVDMRANDDDDVSAADDNDDDQQPEGLVGATTY